MPNLSNRAHLLSELAKAAHPLAFTGDAIASRCRRPQGALRTDAGAGDRSDLPSETERLSHYFEARLLEQFDAVIHIDRTRALIPLEKTVPWEQGEVPETYPFAV